MSENTDPNSATGAPPPALPPGFAPVLPPADPVEIKAPVTKEMVAEALRPVVDPEIHIGVLDLGLVYGVEVADGGKKVCVKFTLTSPACPYGPMLVDQVKLVTGAMPGVESAEVQVVWEPPWDPRTMASDYAKDVLGIW